MPIHPPPTTYSCPACHWTKTVTPKSDALMPHDFFQSCPQCGHRSLQQKPASLGDTLLGELKNWLKKRS